MSAAQYYAICAANGFGNFTLERLFTRLQRANQRFVLCVNEFDALPHHPVLNNIEFYSLEGISDRPERAGSLLTGAATRSIRTARLIRRANPADYKWELVRFCL